MEERINGIQAKCPDHSPFTYTYVASIVDTLFEINQNAFVVYGWLIVVAAPFNIAANIFCAVVLLTSGTPSMSCCPLCAWSASFTKVTAEYLALSLGPFLTMMRYRALRSKGKWEAAYSLAVFASFLAALVAATAGIPTYMINIIDYVPVYMLCRNPAWKDNGVLVPVNAWSQKMYVNNCTLYYTNQVVTGVFHNALPSLLLFAVTIVLAFELGSVGKGHKAVAARSTKKTDDAAKAARMLGVVAILTLISDLPQGLLSIANIALPIGFHFAYSEQLLIVWMIVQTVTTSCNLLIYLAMSKAFRQKVLKIFCGWMQTKTTSPQASIISVSTVCLIALCNMLQPKEFKMSFNANDPKYLFCCGLHITVVAKVCITLDVLPVVISGSFLLIMPAAVAALGLYGVFKPARIPLLIYIFLGFKLSMMAVSILLMAVSSDEDEGKPLDSKVLRDRYKKSLTGDDQKAAIIVVGFLCSFWIATKVLFSYYYWKFSRFIKDREEAQAEEVKMCYSR
ncbi:hypothetical protein PRIPAC_78878 [Pristionchus pacificus]|uniref:Uncharacterized protein n=1 Tax=Pristionchus pacificus TaxID=54126 RepID=A0A2A6CNE5_PRIPA|nr:hypothetical protein PRIPAC_78878 [Pristionchus pacificus]|eukprot:PDM79607.1 hypothetical protein PRIPAC_32186 [Pristionchus pacificus]